MPDDLIQPNPEPAATAAPTQPPAQAPTQLYVGVIDRLLQGRLSGWAVTVQGDPCDVLIRVNDAVVATVLSDVPRPDLHAKQQSRGLGGWSLGIGAQLNDGENRIEALFPDGTHLRGSPLVHDTNASDGVVPIEATGPKTYLGAIDTPDQPIIFGWAVGSDTSEASVVVRINDADPVTIPANLPRPDLIAKQLAQSGGGWMIAVADRLVHGTNRISITYPDGTHLPGSPFERTQGDGAPVVTTVAPTQLPAQPVSSPFGKARRAAAAGAAPVAPPAAPAPRTPAPAPAPPVPQATQSNVTRLPARIVDKSGMPSLPELDEVSLDDLSQAIAAGIIDVTPPPAPEPVPDPMSAEAEDSARAAQPHRTGFLSRLLRRR